MALFELYELSGKDKDRGAFINTTQICYLGPKRGDPNTTIVSMSNGDIVVIEKDVQNVKRFIRSHDRDM